MWNKKIIKQKYNALNYRRKCTISFGVMENSKKIWFKKMILLRWNLIFFFCFLEFGMTRNKIQNNYQLWDIFITKLKEDVA